MIPVDFSDEHAEPEYPDFPIYRYKMEMIRIESAGGLPGSTCVEAGAFVDLGAPYLVLPYHVHHHRDIRIHEDFGLRPYRTHWIEDHEGTEKTRKKVLICQRFCRVGIQFLANMEKVSKIVKELFQKQASGPRRPEQSVENSIPKGLTDHRLKKKHEWRPKEFELVNAYLLDENEPRKVVLVGVQTLARFTVITQGSMALLLEPGESLPSGIH